MSLPMDELLPPRLLRTHDGPAGFCGFHPGHLKCLELEPLALLGCNSNRALQPCEGLAWLCRPASSELLHSAQRGLPHSGLPEP